MATERSFLRNITSAAFTRYGIIYLKSAKSALNYVLDFFLLPRRTDFFSALSTETFFSDFLAHKLTEYGNEIGESRARLTIKKEIKTNHFGCILQRTRICSLYATLFFLLTTFQVHWNEFYSVFFGYKFKNKFIKMLLLNKK